MQVMEAIAVKGTQKNFVSAPVGEINAFFRGWSSHYKSERVRIWAKQIVDILLFHEAYTFKICT